MTKVAKPFLKIVDADIYRNNDCLFKNLNWTINQYEHWIITGDNAAGKSALAEILSGKHFARKGKISYPFLMEAVESGASIYTLKRERIYRASFADHQRKFNTQQHYYQQRFNAFDNDGISVEHYLEKFGYNKADKTHQAIIEQTGLHELLALSRIKLSSGQVRKLLICAAIFKQPDLLIIDNPYIGLDAASRVSFNEMLDYLAFEKGMQIVLSGHFQELPSCISHRLHLDAFKIAAKGLLEDVRNNLKDEKSQAPANSLDALQAYYSPSVWSQRFNTIFELKGINVKYEEVYILKDFDWTIKQGEKWALIGPNGSGKSTILGLFFGDHPQVYSNQVHLFDKTRKENGSIWDIKRKMGFVSPELHFFFGYNFNCFNIALSGYQDAFFLLRKPTDVEREQTRWFFKYFGVEDLIEKKFKRVSTGEQRLVLLIRALVKNPPVLLLDEPFQGLDHKVIEKAKELLDKLLKPEHTLIFITHYEGEIPRCVDRKLKLK